MGLEWIEEDEDEDAERMKTNRMKTKQMKKNLTCIEDVVADSRLKRLTCIEDVVVASGWLERPTCNGTGFSLWCG